MSSDGSVIGRRDNREYNNHNGYFNNYSTPEIKAEQIENLKILKKIMVKRTKFSETNYKGRANFSMYNYSMCGSFESWPIALKILNYLPDSEKSCNELIMENTLVKPYIDIEWKQKEFNSLSETTVKTNITNYIIEIFNNEFSVSLTSNNIYFASCHRHIGEDFKYSFHVVINSKENFCFQNTKCARFLCNKLRNLCDEKEKEFRINQLKEYNLLEEKLQNEIIDLEKDLNNEKENTKIIEKKKKQIVEFLKVFKKNQDETHDYIPKKLIDTSPYGITQNIRMVGHCKIDDPKHPFKIDTPSSATPIDFIITNIDNGNKNDDKIEYNILNVYEEQRDTKYSELKNIDKLSGDEMSKYFEIINQKVKIYHATAELKNMDNKGFFQYNYTDRSEPCFTDKNKERTHDKIGFFAYVFEGKIWMGCHSGNCVVSDENGKGDKKIIECVGSINPVKELLFEKVDYENKFDISNSEIRTFIHDDAIGMSNLFEEMYLKPKRIKWIDEVRNGISYYWNGRLWEEDNYQFLDRLIVKTIVRVLRKFIQDNKKNSDSKCETTEKDNEIAGNIIAKLNSGTMVGNILKFIKPLIRDTEFSKIKDIHPNWLSCKNGMVNLVTGELRAAVPYDNITKSIDLNYDKHSDSSDFEKFVREITSNEKGLNNDVYDYLRWFIGYSLQGAPKKKMFLILYGPNGYNGKSMLMNTISDVLEYYAVTMDKSVVLESQKKTAGSHSTEICQLENCRVGILGDTKEDAAIDDGQMKQLTGVTDKLSVREIFGKQKEFTPTFVPFINTNHAIKVNLSDKAMYERIVIIPFELSFVDEPIKSFERKNDPSLSTKFKQNKEGILKWLIDASIYYNKNPNKLLPKCLKDAKDIYNKQVNNYLDFLDRFFEKDPEASVSRTEFLQAFKNYDKENNLRLPIKTVQKEFDKIITFEKKRNKNYYIGYKFKNEDSDIDEL
jgi:P4 family phage/plasmid primase-like protien